MKTLIGITAVLLGTSNIAYAVPNNEEEHKAHTALLSDTLAITDPFRMKIQESELESLVSILEDYLPNEHGQKKLNASCN